MSIFNHLPALPSGRDAHRGLDTDWPNPSLGRREKKLLAVHRSGVETVVLHAKNSGNLSDVPEEILNELQIEFIDELAQAVKVILKS